MYKEDLTLNNGWYAIKPNLTKPNHIYQIYMYKEDLALNNLQWLICHKNQPTNQATNGEAKEVLWFRSYGSI